MQKVLNIFILFTILILNSSFFTPPEAEKLNWRTLEEVQALIKQNPRPILIDLYTDWCGWCKVMDKKTYSKAKVISYLNEKYYLIKYNAESRQPVQWMGKSYKYSPEYRVNELAMFLSGGELAFPSTIFLIESESYEAPHPLAGYLEPKQLEVAVKYFGEGHYGKTEFEKWAQSYKPTW